MASMCAGRVWHLSKASPMVFRLASFPWASLMSTLEILGWPVRMRVHFGLKERPSKFGLEKMPGGLGVPRSQASKRSYCNYTEFGMADLSSTWKVEQRQKRVSTVGKQLKWDQDIQIYQYSSRFINSYMMQWYSRTCYYSSMNRACWPTWPTNRYIP
jgi:hypothetical protein